MNHPIDDNQIDKLPISNFDEIDHVIVQYSGGKDSQATALWALKHFPKNKIELWHQDVDGADGDDNKGLKFDWAVTRAYCKATAKALGLPLHFGWRDGGIGREIYKTNERAQSVFYKTPDGDVTEFKTDPRFSKPRTRRMWPAVQSSLIKRWCSSIVKIEVSKRIINNLPRFKAEEGQKPPVLLVITGERWEEGTENKQTGDKSGRALYTYIPNDGDKTTKHRRVINFRPILHWKEAEVWEVIKEAKITPHPAYQMGFSRCSCQTCIFGGCDEFATNEDLSPEKILAIARVEKDIEHNLKSKNDGIYKFISQEGKFHRKEKGKPRRPKEEGKSFLPNDLDADFVLRTMRGEFRDDEAITENWQMPAGAFKGSSAGAI